MNDKGSNSHSEKSGFGQRWMWGVVSLFVLLLLLGCLAIPISQNYSKMEELRKIVSELKGKTTTTPGYLLTCLPVDWNDWLQKKVGKKWIAALSRCESIRISSKEINDTHLDFLSRFNDVVDIDLSETNITDEGLYVFRRMPSLENLWICNTEVDGSGFAELENLISLKDLSLSNTKVVDESLVYLKSLKKLEYLYFNNTQVSDVGLAHLKGLANLKHLYLGNTQVTQQGIDELQKELPSCQIHF